MLPANSPANFTLARGPRCLPFCQLRWPLTSVPPPPCPSPWRPQCVTRAACGATCRTSSRPSSRASRRARAIILCTAMHICLICWSIAPRGLPVVRLVLRPAFSSQPNQPNWAYSLHTWNAPVLPSLTPEARGMPQLPACAHSAAGFSIGDWVAVLSSFCAQLHPSCLLLADPVLGADTCRTWVLPASARHGGGWTAESSGSSAAPGRRRQRAACTTCTRLTSAPGDCPTGRRRVCQGDLRWALGSKAQMAHQTVEFCLCFSTALSLLQTL